jgi:transcriptional regulator with XRE-family HTH domain
VRSAREEARLSLRQLAGVEMTHAHVDKIERGLVRPSMSALEVIARRTGKEVTYFLEDGGDMLSGLRADVARAARLAKDLVWKTSLTEADRRRVDLAELTLSWCVRLLAEPAGEEGSGG